MVTYYPTPVSELIINCYYFYPQERGEWEGVHHLVVGDFAHLGHDQVLLLFKGKIKF